MERRSRPKNKSLGLFLMIIWVCLVAASPFIFWGGVEEAEAYNFKQGLNLLGQDVGLAKKNNTPIELTELVGNLIYYALSLVGVVFLVLIVLAGLRWLFAEGNEEGVTRAKQSLWTASIGFLVTMGAYAITYFIFEVLLK